MSDAMPDSRLRPDAPRAVVIAAPAAQHRHATALEASGARILAAIGPADLDRLLSGLVAAELILLDGMHGPPHDAATQAERIVAWASGSACRVIALLDRDSLDDAAPPLIDAGATLLCAPSPADYAAAIAEATRPATLRLHDVSSERERERLQRLNEEVARLAAVLSDFAADPVRRDLREPGRGFRAEPGEGADPAPRMVRSMIRARRLRDQHFHPELFADPAWDMLLDLYAARLEGVRVSVSSLCIAAAVPPTTALRWIGTLHDAGLFEREPDPIDRRRAHIKLTDRAAAAMRSYFAATERQGLIPG
ncbi:winged helix DNA-binding protein [Sphingomonas sp.]|uniref:winged helix DNA-binding protein n=1 Tax=Sphingomonas sp. TaxID=28214 RepID=UPI00307D49B6